MAKTSAAKGASMTFTPHRKKPKKPRQPRSTRRARTAAARPWPCKCTRCANETTTAKQICCGASSAVNCLATTQHAGIATCTTHVDSDINDEPNLWSTSGPPASVSLATGSCFDSFTTPATSMCRWHYHPAAGASLLKPTLIFNYRNIYFWLTFERL